MSHLCLQKLFTLTRKPIILIVARKLSRKGQGEEIILCTQGRLELPPDPFQGKHWPIDGMQSLFGVPYAPQNGSQYCQEEENYYGHYKKMSKIFHCCSLSVLSIMLVEEAVPNCPLDLVTRFGKGVK